MWLFNGAVVVLLLIGYVEFILGHTYLSSIYLNGQALAEGDCVRPHPATAKDFPLPSVTVADNTCSWLPAAASPANRKCPIQAGSTIGVQWYHNTPGPTDDILAATHKGPIQFFLAKSENGAGNVWFKIYEDGYTDATKLWATDKLIANRGRIDVVIPSDISPGNYLLRGEILALHEAATEGKIQPYIGCVELSISGSGKANPSGVAFPGFYSPTGTGIIFNLYAPYSSYPIPGPPLYRPGTSSTSGTSSTPLPTASPGPTSTPRPTSSPSPSPTSTVKVQLNNGSGVWWVGVVVNGGGETVVKVEMKDSGTITSWFPMVDLSYAYVFDESKVVQLPLSLRITSSSNKQVILNNYITSWTNLNVLDTGKYFV